MQEAPGGRLISMSASGRFVAIRQRDGLAIVDALGTAPRLTLPVELLSDFAVVGPLLWAAGGGQLHRFQLESGREVGAPAPLPGEGRLVPAQGEKAASALWLGGQRHLVTLVDGAVRLEDIGAQTEAADFTTSLGGRRLLIAEDRRVRVCDVGGADLSAARLPNGGTVTAAGNLLGGRALGVLASAAEASWLVVYRPGGALIHVVELPPVDRCVIAETRGIAVACSTAGRLIAVDLRFGKVLGDTEAAIPVEDLGIDTNGKYLALAGFGDEESLSVLHLSYAEVFGVRTRSPEGTPVIERHEDAAAETEAPDAEAARPASGATAPAPDTTDEGAGPPAPVAIPDVHLVAFGQPLAPLQVKSTPGAAPYGSPQEHLDDLLDFVGARAARAISDAWDSGRLSLAALDSRPFEREVLALVGGRASGAPDHLAAADRHVLEVTERLGRRQQASVAQGVSLPFLDIIREFGLSQAASRVLLVVAGPALRGEIARLYGILANDEARPICDRHLVQVILGGDDRAARHAIAVEMADDAPLLRHGLVRVTAAPNDHYLFASLTVDPVLLSRLRGDRWAGTGPGAITLIRRGSRDLLEQLAMPAQLKRDLVLALASAPPEDQPVRLVLRGRPGAGRRTVLAALAARADKPLAVINAEQLPRGGRRFAEALVTQLRRAALRGAIPCISGIEVMDPADTEGAELVRTALRSHPGPVTLRTSPEHKPPLEPGYLNFAIPPLTETERLAFWRLALARRGLQVNGIEELAGRFRIGPGTIETVIATTAARRAADPEAAADAGADLDHAARQHVETRLGSVATRVTRMARWEQVALPDDVLDSIREFLGRVQHRRQVYEEWGYDKKMTTSRGLTALFYGPPGTGKSMVGGLIARELGLDLYRIDLAQVTSKWIGETEKNLGEVFDAAEDGQCVILFDEADALFAKRTEVKSSVDRYANLEVNYLLQRLDSFDGVAILTTNLEGSLDTAFKRRMSLRLAFPFPDEEMRVRLWLAHIPAEVPTRGDFDFQELAKRYPMSGGYIRNSALRAAFLAAQEGVPLSQGHIERAIHLEYREMGKLAAGGKME